MSFILNALRKSEQERQRTQELPLENRILQQAEDKGKKTSIWLILLVLINICFLLYFVWPLAKSQQENPTEPLTKKEISKPSQPATNSSNIKHSIVEQKKAISALNTLIGNKKNNEKLATATDSKSKTISIAEQLKQQSHAIKPVISEPVESAPVIQKIKTAKPQLKTENPPTPIINQVSSVVSKDSESSIPFLSELSYEFRRSTPDIDINVYVYSENKHDRFIMVNMKKYMAGQQIEPGLTIKEIGKDSLVLEYKNKVFQIKRK